jgi:hypothetical protein
MAEYFCSLFPRRDVYICKARGQENWKTWHKLEDHQILGVIANGGRGIFRGCHWDAKTRYAVLDLDETSKYYNKENLAELLTAVDQVGLKANVYQSSDSGGWHLYIPLADWEQSRDVEQTLKRWLKARGYELKGGQLEVFPSGNALRLPLQPGFAWLNAEGDLIRSREELGRDEAITAFLTDLEVNARNWGEAKALIESQVSAIDRAAGRDVQAHAKAIDSDGFDELFNYRVIQEYCDKARQYLAFGLTEPKTRHEAIYTIQHLLWHGDGLLGVPALPGHRNAARRFEFLKRWLESNHNGQCRHINGGDWQTVLAHIYRVVNWQRSELRELSKYEPYKRTERAEERLFQLFLRTGRIWTMEDLKKANDDRQEKARSKIKRAVGDCLQQGRQVSRKTLEAITGCSPNTIRKHSDLWKLFAAGSGVLISGGRGPLCLVPVLVSEETSKQLTESELQTAGNEFSVFVEDTGNYQEGLATANSNNGKIPFILPYGSQRRPNAAENKAAIEQAARATVESARALNCFYVFDSLRCDIYGATANNSTASDYRNIAPSLPASLTTGSNTVQGSSLVRAVRSLNGFLPAGAGPLHLPQTLGSLVVAHPRALVTSRQGQGSFLVRKLGHQSNRMWRLSGSCCG